MRTKHQARFRIVAAALLCLIAAPTLAADKLRVSVQKTGTVSWEIAVAKAREALEDPAAWAPIRERVGAKDDATFELYRRRYLEGAPKRSVAEEAADGAALFAVIAEIGGAELTGPAKTLDPAAFYDPAKGL